MKPAGNQRGSALLAALSIALLLIPLGAFVALQSQTDAMLLRNLRDELDAFYVAEAGLDHALADIAPDTSLTGLLAGPDHLSGTADDGSFPFTEGRPAPFPVAPLAYEVRIAPHGAGTVELVSSGSGRNGAAKQVSAIVALAALPFTPAALYLEGEGAATDIGSAGFALSGLDHRAGDVPNAASGTAQAVPALGTPGDETAQALRSRLAALGTDVSGAGDAPSVATTAALDVAAVAKRCTERTDRFTLPAPLVDGSTTLGSRAHPQLSVSPGDLTVSGTLEGEGILFVDGTLRVSGSLTFGGLLIVRGALILEPSSHVMVAGALWHSPGIDGRMVLDGSGAIVYSSEALANADDAFSGLLPHAATAVGWREIL